MRIHCLLNWYDESAIWLAATVASVAPHVDHLVAIDGAYGLYPNGEPQSRSDQAQSIVETCQAAGLGLTLHRPQTRWLGNEVEKRSFMFKAAELAAEPHTDWYLIMDSDQTLNRCPPDLHQRLATTTRDTAEVLFWERTDPQQHPARAKQERTVALPPDSHYPVRILFRAIPGLHVHQHHATYRTPDHHYLWGTGNTPLEPTLDLHDLRVEHRTQYRTKHRREAARAYYKRRDQTGAETIT